MPWLGILVLAILLLCTACDRSGLSRPFRKAAEQSVELLQKAEASESPTDLAEAERALTEGKKKLQTGQDVQLADVLDWYAILVHRHNRARTRGWRQVCSAEVQLYFRGEPSGDAKVGSEDVQVVRGDCQNAAFDMMAEDCRQTGRKPSECMPDALTAKQRKTR